LVVQQRVQSRLNSWFLLVTSLVCTVMSCILLWHYRVSLGLSLNMCIIYTLSLSLSLTHTHNPLSAWGGASETTPVMTQPLRRKSSFSVSSQLTVRRWYTSILWSCFVVIVHFLLFVIMGRIEIYSHYNAWYSWVLHFCFKLNKPE
jgi:hypothetical protein